MEFSSLEEGTKAIQGLKDKKLRGRVITIDWAVSKRDYNPTSASTEIVTGNEESQDSIQDQSEDGDGAQDTTPSSESDQDIDQDDEASRVAMEEDDTVSIKHEAKPKGLLEGTTLFLRNVSFDTTEEKIHEVYAIQ